MECEDNIHDWEHSSWGVIIGVSKCKKCGKVAKEEDFNITLDIDDSILEEIDKLEDIKPN